MVRTRFSVSLAVLALVLAASGCAKKTGPEGAAAGAAGTDSSGMPTGTETNVTATGSETAAVSIPAVFFDYNQATIRSDAKQPLKTAAETLKGSAASQVTIEGHCDERGSSEYNLALGERRAQAVKNYLRNLGIDGKRLSTISYGKERPADPAHTEDAWAKNRRAELIVNR